MAGGNIIVIGAGVIGLTCALELVRKGYKVVIIARDLPGDLTIEYSSPWAGAHFRPVPITNDAEKLEQHLVKETYYEFEKLATSDPSTGIRFIPGVEYFDNPTKAYTDLKDEAGFNSWPEFRVLRKDEFPNDEITWGVSYRSWVINTPVYLSWLRRQIELRGGKIIRHSLPAIPEAVFIAREGMKKPQAEFEAVVNASGMGFADPDCFPSRGQFLLISNPCAKTISYQTADGEAVVIIPRPLDDGTLIGGTKEVNNWSPIPSDISTAGILEKVSKLCPKLLTRPENEPNSEGALHVLRINVGRRPMRKGGLRLEAESSSYTQTKTDGLKIEAIPLKIVHCYGAGGNGYKLSWGTARRVVELVALA